MSEYKKNKCKYLIVMGCLVERYKDELEKEIPEVDLFVKFSEYSTIWEQISKLIKNKKEEEKLNFNNRIITTGDNFAYLRIAEGCSNHCTYCAIPSIRGPYISRKIEDVIDEANELAKKGYKELIVIAQDTTKYGIDIYGEPKLAELLEKLCKIEGVHWIRFLYAYPETIDDKLIKVVKENKKICKYFDIPIQHISDKVLKRMNRKSTGNSIRELFKKLRKEIPNVIIRTTVMVGFPGETQEDFEELYNFIKEYKVDRLGAFTYSKEDNTPAEKLKDQIHPNTKKSRYNKVMELQQLISKEKMKDTIGKEYEVLIETKTFDGKYYVGRSYEDVPDIDGLIYIKNNFKENLEGKFIKCKITNVKEYDKIGKIINKD